MFLRLTYLNDGYHKTDVLDYQLEKLYGKSKRKRILKLRTKVN